MAKPKRTHDAAYYIELGRGVQFVPPHDGLPTGAQPGSAEKVQAMADRYAAGQSLHHPSDINCFSPDVPVVPRRPK